MWDLGGMTRSVGVEHCDALISLDRSLEVGAWMTMVRRCFLTKPFILEKSREGAALGFR